MIVEKPLTRDSGGAALIEQAAAERKLAVLVFFARRFIPEVAATIEAQRRHAWTHADVKVRSAVMAGPWVCFFGLCGVGV